MLRSIGSAVAVAGVAVLAGAIVAAGATASLERKTAHPSGGTALERPLAAVKSHPRLWERVRGLARQVERQNERRRTAGEEAAAVHPVAGDFDYGDSGAGFGADRYGHAHEGQDVFAPAGTPLVAVREATVVEAGSDGERGNHLALYSAESDETYVYFHMLSPPSVAVGETVSAGDPVGEVGCSGSCDGDHLHFEVHAGEGAEAPAIDPLPLLESWGASA